MQPYDIQLYYLGLTMYTDLATTLFYLVIDECLTDEAASCPPLRYLITGCLESLGETVISNQVFYLIKDLAVT